jgi:uncharacterized protein YutE (UPF0331/DUF86 family)
LVDKVLIGRKISELETYLNQIREFRKISVARYNKDWKTQRIVERTLQILIELCIDIANHLISDRGMRLPTSYSDTFRVLMEQGIISKYLYKKMENMAKFRNVIVHQYEDINSRIVVSILHKNIKDFEKYKQAIIKCISQG